VGTGNDEEHESMSTHRAHTKFGIIAKTEAFSGVGARAHLSLLFGTSGALRLRCP